MKFIQSALTPVSYIINLNNYGLVKGAKAQLKNLNLAELILLSDDFNCSKYLHQVGDVRLKQLRKDIVKSKEYKVVKEGEYGCRVAN